MTVGEANRAIKEEIGEGAFHQDGTKALYAEKRKGGIWLCDYNTCVRLRRQTLSQVRKEAREWLKGVSS